MLRGPGDPVLVTELPPPEGTAVARRRRASATGSPRSRRAAASPRLRGGRNRAAYYREAQSALWGEGGSAVRQRPAGRRAGDQRRGSAEASEAGAWRGHAVDQRPRDPRRAAPGAARSAAHLRGDAAGDGAGLALSRQHDRAADPAARGGGAARPRPRRPHRNPRDHRAQRRDRRAGRGAARDDRRAVAADERDRELRGRCRARDQEPALLAAQRGRDRRAHLRSRKTAPADRDHPGGCRAARSADHRYFRRLAARCRAEPPRILADRYRGDAARRWSRFTRRPVHRMRRISCSNFPPNSPAGSAR